MRERLRLNSDDRALLRHIQARISLCRDLKAAALTQQARDEWQAEESGLVDALFGLDRTAIQRERHPDQFPRYLLGLQDGQTLMNAVERCARPAEGGARPGRGSAHRSLKRTASRDTSFTHRHVA